MKNLIFITFTALVLLSSCSIFPKDEKEAYKPVDLNEASISPKDEKEAYRPIDLNEVSFSDQFKKEFDIFYKRDEHVYANSDIIASNPIKAGFLFDNSYVFQFRNNKNYVVVSDGNSGSLNNKVLNINGKKIDSRYYGFVENYLFNGTNAAYYKCEKLIFFSDTNTNDCLANQIWLDDRLIDSIDMDFLNKNRKYPFHLKFLDKTNFIYQKGDKFYVLKIGDEKAKEFTEADAIRNKYKSNKDLYDSFNLIGFVNDKILYSFENYGNMYDDVLVEKIKAILIKNGMNQKKNEYLFDALESGNFKSIIQYPLLYSESDDVNFGETIYSDEDVSMVSEIHGLHYLKPVSMNKISDLYINGTLYDDNVVASRIIDNDIYTIKYGNNKFEEVNPYYFGRQEKSLGQTFQEDTSKAHITYSLYKNKDLMGKIEFKTVYDFGINGKIKFIDGETTPCVFSQDNSEGEDLTICVHKGGFVAQTRMVSNTNKEMNTNILIWNGLKLNLENFIYNEKTKEESYKVGVSGTYFQPIFNQSGSLSHMMIYGALTNEAFKEMIKALSFKEDEMFKYVAEKTGIKDVGILKKVDKEGEEKLTAEEKIEFEKAKKFLPNFFESTLKHGLFISEYTGNGNFSIPLTKAGNNINDFYGAVRK